MAGEYLKVTAYNLVDFSWVIGILQICWRVTCSNRILFHLSVLFVYCSYLTFCCFSCTVTTWRGQGLLWGLIWCISNPWWLEIWSQWRCLYPRNWIMLAMRRGLRQLITMTCSQLCLTRNLRFSVLPLKLLTSCVLAPLCIPR